VDRVGARADHGTGLLSSVAGVVVFLVFLLFAVQLLFGLYASSTVNAVANDAAVGGAAAPAPPPPRLRRSEFLPLTLTLSPCEVAWGEGIQSSWLVRATNSWSSWARRSKARKS
jgi:hypothetical protein